MKTHVPNTALAEIRQDFCRQWAPDYGYARSDFEIGLDRLIYAAFAAAQEPFRQELETLREYNIKTAFGALETKE